MNDRTELLQRTSEEIVTAKPIGVRFLLTVLLILAIAWLVLFPRIYLNNAIYHKSREIATMQREYETLKEENRLIRARIEAQRYKIQILDTMNYREE